MHFMQPHSRQQGAPARHKRQDQACYRCGGTNHSSATCRFRDSDCLHCGKKGHIAKVCRSRADNSKSSQRGRRPHKQPQPKPTHHVDEELPEDPVYTLFHVPTTRPFPMVVTMQLNQAPLGMEVDTGATASLISEHTYKSLWPAEKAPALQPSEVKLCTYTGEELQVYYRSHRCPRTIRDTTARAKLACRSRQGTKFARTQLVGTNSPGLALAKQSAVCR